MRCLVIMVVLSATAAAQEAVDRTIQVKTKKHATAVARGRAEADTQLGLDKASIWEYGQIEIERLLFESLDRATGLYFSSFGCVIDDEIVGRVEGHNARIAEYIQGNGPPKNSFKPWEKELFGLKEYFESRCRSDKPIRLIVGGPLVVSPDREFAVKLVKRPDRTFDGLPTESTWIVVGDQDIESKRTGIWKTTDADFFWGPKGSWFAVLRGRDKPSEKMEYMALDLRDVRTIRRESGESRAPRSGDLPFKDPYDIP